MKRAKTTTRKQLKVMANNWVLYPEVAAANRTQNVWVKLTAQFNNFKATKAFNKSFQELMNTLKQHHNALQITAHFKNFTVDELKSFDPQILMYKPEEPSGHIEFGNINEENTKRLYGNAIDFIK